MTLTRRELLCRSTLGVGAFALADLMGRAFADDAAGGVLDHEPEAGESIVLFEKLDEFLPEQRQR